MRRFMSYRLIPSYSMTDMRREAPGSVVLPIEKGVTDIPQMSSLARSQTVQKLDVEKTTQRRIQLF